MSVPLNLNENGYRLVAGIMLMNDEEKVFVGQRINTDVSLNQRSGKGWQMPQGGIDKGEAPLQAAFRELKEETGCDKANFIAESQNWYQYQLPPNTRSMLWGGQIHTIKQKWFLFHFTGIDEDINLNAFRPPEFSDWKWVALHQVIDLIVDFKKEVYKSVVKEFEQYF